MFNRHVAEPHAPQTEGRVAKTIERQTSKVPSDVFLWGGLSALGIGFLMSMRNRRDTGNFITQLAPVFLIMGLYNKLVKIEGHDREDTEV